MVAQNGRFENSHVSPGSGHPRLGLWFAISTALFGTVSLVFAIITPARLGPFAAAGTTPLVYPYDQAARFVPGDFVWMHPALLMLLSFLALSVCLSDRTTEQRRVLGTLGLTLAAVSFGVLAIDYFIQLQAVQPGLLGDEGVGLAAISMYNRTASSSSWRISATC